MSKEKYLMIYFTHELKYYFSNSSVCLMHFHEFSGTLKLEMSQNIPLFNDAFSVILRTLKFEMPQVCYLHPDFMMHFHEFL